MDGIPKYLPSYTLAGPPNFDFLKEHGYLNPKTVSSIYGNNDLSLLNESFNGIYIKLFIKILIIK